MSKFVAWIDQKIAGNKIREEPLIEYYAPKNFNFFYFLEA